MRIFTTRGYDFGAVSSAMQKAIRRADRRLACYWAAELWQSGYGNYVWKRLLTVSAEDVAGLITGEIKLLHDSYTAENDGVAIRDHAGLPHILKAVILLCAARKSRDADHLQNYVYDKGVLMNAPALANLLSLGTEPVPAIVEPCGKNEQREFDMMVKVSRYAHLRSVRKHDIEAVLHGLRHVLTCELSAINRATLAGYCALELWHSRYHAEVWRHLHSLSPAAVASELRALHHGYRLVNEGKPPSEAKGRIFISKAVLLMILRGPPNCPLHELDAIDVDALAAALIPRCRRREERIPPIPDYAFDCHTIEGRRRGRTKADFFREEQRALRPLHRGFLDALPETNPTLFA